MRRPVLTACTREAGYAATPGTEVGYAGTQAWCSGQRYGVRCSLLASPTPARGTGLRPPYAMPAYAGIGLYRALGDVRTVVVSAYRRAMRCPVVTLRMVVPGSWSCACGAGWYAPTRTSIAIAVPIRCYTPRCILKETAVLTVDCAATRILTVLQY
eukprot:2046450-Rhodomonas_salina.2